MKFILMITFRNFSQRSKPLWYLNAFSLFYVLSALTHPVTNLPCILGPNYSYFQPLYYYRLSDLVCVCLLVSL